VSDNPTHVPRSTAIDEEIHPKENSQRAGFEPIPLRNDDGTEILGAIVNPSDYELVRLTWGGAPFLFDAPRDVMVMDGYRGPGTATAKMVNLSSRL
jgi:hypothetical protein